ncbi:MAG TPA: helix-turn-helix transcriptional regulator [Actinomycetota bacterium]|nr:helix-turn-helix transcriptional regulator [Actinomycetota bacterium]
MAGFFTFDGPALRELREAKGWRREHLALTLGVSAGAVDHWESGRRSPSRMTVIRLAAVLGCHPRDLLAEDPLHAGMSA